MNILNKIAYYLPDTILSNDDLAKLFPEWHADKIEDKIGIRERHIAGENETALDLAIKASEIVLQKEDKKNIDFILFCTQSPDYFLPTTACILQDKLGLGNNIGALDFNLGCSGYIYGMSLAKGLISANAAKKVLLVTAETYSKHIHNQDKGNRSVFGDAASATVIDDEFCAKLGKFSFGTDGKGFANLIVENGGFRNKALAAKTEIDANGNIVSPDHLFMNGPEIFNFTIQKIPSLIENVLLLNNINYEEVDFFIFHQANKFMLDYLRKKLKIPEEKFYNNMKYTGNTVSSTIPIAVFDAYSKHFIKEGDKVLLAGFGVGYSWGATILTI